jgi:uncharacterized membrane protein YccC
VRIADPGRFALKGALRAAVVMPLAFALGDVVIGNSQVALFAAFGSIALLVFVEFGGSLRARFAAYVGLALAGAATISLGTLCSDSTVLAAVMMFVVGFGVLFAGVLNGYIAAAQPAAILSFVLALMVPAEASQIPDRLAGWGIAATLATAAVLLVWPQRPRSVVRSGAARAARALAELIESEDPAARQAHSIATRTAIRAARNDFVSMQHRPSGTGGRTAALARLIEDLAWIRRFGAQDPDPVDDAEIEAAREAIERQVPAVLRQAAAQLEGTVPVGDGAPGGPGGEAVAELTRAHDRLGRATLARMATLAERGEEAEAEASRELDATFRLRLLSFITAEVASTTRRTLGASVGGGVEVARARLDAAGKLARAHASMRSVWLRNSLRGALGLALAVLLAQLADLQNAFWVVLGTLSVLRSSALATGSTMAWALAGCFAGIVVGGLLVIAVDGSEAALWILLPFATALAAYTPRAVSFAAGQAGFSIVVLVLFNLIHPSGWEVGLLRFEDVAIGAGVSLLVGLLFWPRGAVTVLRRAVGSAYTSAAAYLDATVSALLRGAPVPAEAEREAFAAAQVLDSGVRDYLSDRSGANAPIEQLTVLMAGAAWVREVAGLLDHSGVLIRIGSVDPTLPRADAARLELEAERDRRCGWYTEFGAALAARQPVPDPEPAPPGSAPVALERAPGADGDPPGVAIAWARRYLEALRDLERPLAQVASPD